MTELPGKNVSDEEFYGLQLRGQLTELEDLALSSGGGSESVGAQLEEATRIARELVVRDELEDQVGLANELADELENVRGQLVSAANLEGMLETVVQHIPDDRRGDLTR